MGMAIFLEFVLSILLYLLFSFLLAKLFSVSSSFSSNSDDDGRVSVSSPRELMSEKVAESKKNDYGGEGRTGFVSEVADEADDCGESREENIKNQETLNDSCGSRNDFKVDEDEVLRELSEGNSGKFGGASEFEVKMAVESTESENIAKIEEDLTEHEVGIAKIEEIVVSESEYDNEILEANSNEKDGGLSDRVEILVDESTESEIIDKTERELCTNETGEANKNEEDGVNDDDDDDWEGVERTELERLFGSAVAFVGSKSNADRIRSLGSLVKMHLYGLHKIATQGPCHEPQPMALKVSARANWNAWKSFGNMTPEDAMEQYVTILSRNIPGCIQYDIDGGSKMVSADSDLNAWKMNKVGPVNERNVDELMPSLKA